MCIRDRPAPEPEGAVIYIPHFDQDQNISTEGLIEYEDGRDAEYNVKLTTTVTVAEIQQSFLFLPSPTLVTQPKAKYVKRDMLPDNFLDYNDVNGAQLDFIQHLAHEVFGSYNAVDLFSNEYEIAIAYATAIEQCIENVNDINGGIGSLPGIGETVYDEPANDNLETGANGALDVLRGLLSKHRTRFDEVNYSEDGEYVPMPIRSGDILHIVFTIKSSDNQRDASGNLVSVSRKALIEIQIV